MAKKTAQHRRPSPRPRVAPDPGTGQPRPVDGDVASHVGGRAGLEARLGFAFGALAFLALPIAYTWTFRPSSRPPGSDVLIPILELGGVLAAGAALLLGRRARAAGDRTTGAVWAPRLGGAAIVGYVMMLVVTLSRSA